MGSHSKNEVGGPAHWEENIEQKKEKKKRKGNTMPFIRLLRSHGYKKKKRHELHDLGTELQVFYYLTTDSVRFDPPASVLHFES